MTPYADYAYYLGAYLGSSIGEEGFPRLALRASQYLDYYTQGRAREHPCLPQLKMACCALAEQYQAIEGAGKLAGQAIRKALDASEPEVKSRTVGPLSETYESGGESAAQAAALEKEARDVLVATAREYLAGTGLLYRGRGRCGCACSPTL